MVCCFLLLVTSQLDKRNLSNLTCQVLSFFLSSVPNTQPNHWTKRMASTRLATLDPRTCPGPEDRSITYFMADPSRSPTSGQNRSQC